MKAGRPSVLAVLDNPSMNRHLALPVEIDNDNLVVAVVLADWVEHRLNWTTAEYCSPVVIWSGSMDMIRSEPVVEFGTLVVETCRKQSSLAA
jgi:hypothetical protein